MLLEINAQEFLTDKVLGMPLYSHDDFMRLLYRFTFNFVFILAIVRYIYYPLAKKKEYLFTYMLISTVVFLLCFLLDNVKLQLGFALGLFAIFGIIRYRTDAIPIKEMTYLFIVIGLSVVNALVNKKISHAELVFTNMVVFFLAYGLEKIWFLKHESKRTINYENIELIKVQNYELLLKDVEERTGLIIERIEIGRIDFLTDTAFIKIFYYPEDQPAQDIPSYE